MIRLDRSGPACLFKCRSRFEIVAAGPGSLLVDGWQLSWDDEKEKIPQVRSRRGFLTGLLPK